jgi:hypothetical protein
MDRNEPQAADLPCPTDPARRGEPRLAPEAP